METKRAVSGLLVIDKPGGMTSRAVVNRVQSLWPRGSRIGHTGTLDPLATGVLVLCLGPATRLTEYVQRMDKVYRARLLLGARSDTDDADGLIHPVPNLHPPEPATVAELLHGFVGEIEQVPPDYSAAKVTGRRAYHLARLGQDVDLQPRRVHIYGIEILAYEYPHLDIEVRCGKGTYIRSLARDLGGRLGCGAIIEALRRTRVGPFQVESAVGLDVTGETASKSLLPIAMAVADLPRLAIGPEEIVRIRQGQSIPCHQSAHLEKPAEVAIFDARDNLVAIGTIEVEQQVLRPLKVFAE